MKKFAFTLSEVLITLVIIGVVAAMTIPAFLNNSNQQEYKSAIKKAISAANQALMQNYALEGLSAQDYSTAKDVQGKPFPEKLNEIWYLTPFKVQNFRILYHYSKKDLVETLQNRIGLSLEQMQEKSIQFEKKLTKQL